MNRYRILGFIMILFFFEGSLLSRPIFKKRKKINSQKAARKFDRGNTAKANQTLSLNISGSYLMPFSDYKDIIKSGYGINSHLGIENAFWPNLYLSGSLGFLYGKTADDHIQSLSLIPISIFAGYAFHFFKVLDITPSLGWGYMFHLISYDNNGSNTSGIYKYSVEYFFNPQITAKVDIGYKITRSLNIVFTPAYTLLFSKDSNKWFLNFLTGIQFSI